MDAIFCSCALATFYFAYQQGNSLTFALSTKEEPLVVIEQSEVIHALYDVKEENEDDNILEKLTEQNETLQQRLETCDIKTKSLTEQNEVLQQRLVAHDMKTKSLVMYAKNAKDSLALHNAIRKDLTEIKSQMENTNFIKSVTQRKEQKAMFQQQIDKILSLETKLGVCGFLDRDSLPDLSMLKRKGVKNRHDLITSYSDSLDDLREHLYTAILDTIIAGL